MPTARKIGKKERGKEDQSTRKKYNFCLMMMQKVSSSTVQKTKDPCAAILPKVCNDLQSKFFKKGFVVLENLISKTYAKELNERLAFKITYSLASSRDEFM